MSNLIASFDHYDFLSNFVAENVVDDPVCIEMSELYWECFECVAFWYIIFDTCLKFIIGEGLSTYSFKFVVA